MKNNEIIFILAALAIVLGAMIGGVLAGSLLETQRMTACVESGQQWKMNEHNLEGECVR